MTELAKDLEYEALRTHHSVLRYSPDVFPINQNIFGIMQQLNRLVVVRTPQDWDEGIFFDKESMLKLGRYREHLLVSIGQLIKDKDWNADIDLLEECIPVPEHILLADARKLITHIGNSKGEMLSSTEPAAIPLLKQLLPQTTLYHEADHVDASRVGGDESAYFLHSLLIADTGGKKTMMKGTCFAHHRKLDTVNDIRVSLAPKFPSSGDFRNAKSKLANFGANVPDEIDTLIKEKSRTMAYVVLPGESKPTPVYMPELRNDQNRRIYDWDELKFVDPRRLAYYIGKDYVKDEFVKLTSVNEKNVCRLGIVHVNG